jgi:hypothetical protein
MPPSLPHLCVSVKKGRSRQKAATETQPFPFLFMRLSVDQAQERAPSVDRNGTFKRDRNPRPGCTSSLQSTRTLTVALDGTPVSSPHLKTIRCHQKLQPSDEAQDVLMMIPRAINMTTQ